MNVRAEIEKKIDKKRNEIKDLEQKINAAKSHLDGLQEALKCTPADEGEASVELRAGSDMDKARNALRLAGRPLHIDEIRNHITDKAWTVGKATGFAGSLSSYAKKGRVFTKTAPKTFGLIEFNTPKNVSVLNVANG